MMLAIQRKADESTAVKVNLLPVRIQYDGSMEIEKKHWNPECTEGANSGLPLGHY